MDVDPLGERAPVGMAPDPRTGHECGDSRYLAIPWIDACLAMRLPDKGDDASALKLATKQPMLVATLFNFRELASSWLPNEKLLAVLGKDMNLLSAFKSANNVLLGAVQGIAELITCPGLINVDFADVRTVMSEMGMAMMGSGMSHGEHRARAAAQAALLQALAHLSQL